MTPEKIIDLILAVWLGILSLVAALGVYAVWVQFR